MHSPESAVEEEGHGHGDAMMAGFCLFSCRSFDMGNLIKKFRLGSEMRVWLYNSDERVHYPAFAALERKKQRFLCFGDPKTKTRGFQWET